MEALRLSKFLSYKFSYKFEDFFSYLGVVGPTIILLKNVEMMLVLCYS